MLLQKIVEVIKEVDKESKEDRINDIGQNFWLDIVAPSIGSSRGDPDDPKTLTISRGDVI